MYIFSHPWGHGHRLKLEAWVVIATYRRRLDSSSTLLQEPQILYKLPWRQPVGTAGRCAAEVSRGVSSAWWCASRVCEMCKTVFKLAVWRPQHQPGMTQSLATEAVTCDTFGLLLVEHIKGLLYGHKNVNGSRANVMYFWHHGAHQKRQHHSCRLMVCV